MKRFNFEDDGVRSASEEADAKLRSAVGGLRKWRSAIMMSCLLFATVILPIASTSIGDLNDWEYWARAGCSLVIAFMSYYTLFPIGAKTERAESKTYTKVIEKWKTLSERVRNGGLMELFYKFGFIRVVEERQELRFLCIDAAGIPMSVYEEKYASLGFKELKKLWRSGELTKKQIKYIRAAEGEFRVKPINTSLILSGLAIKNPNDAGRRRAKELWGYGRPLLILITTAAQLLIEFSYDRPNSFGEYFVDVFINVFMVVSWSFAGFRFGIEKAQEEESDASGRTEFIEMFLERYGRGEFGKVMEEEHTEVAEVST